MHPSQHHRCVTPKASLIVRGPSSRQPRIPLVYPAGALGRYPGPGELRHDDDEWMDDDVMTMPLEQNDDDVMTMPLEQIIDLCAFNGDLDKLPFQLGHLQGGHRDKGGPP